ncbi:RNA polymerase sigma-70 factor [Flavivirga rizhaonensis]|uniref:RNA polymerase sigma-70 factor n=1 Tax=Flavivirga rizhaonensis TaxID=2559571 RepID=A0A4S1E002_9FLAO|nr:RNA polymerase sigma-70 factor [Flavivirga rizhaonensis]TGV03615.1 RNA polymerase sigma-70 factor [Flavivirga rizhaonensis]
MIEENDRLSLGVFEKIFNRLYSPLCLFANKYVNDVNYSEDIVQEVFVKAWEKGLYFEDLDKAKGFFYVAVKNASLNFLKSHYSKSVKAHPPENLEILQTENYFIKETVILEASALVEKAIEALPPKCREVMKLSFEGLTNQEIANKLGISFETVKSYKSDAYKKLRKDLAHLRIK